LSSENNYFAGSFKKLKNHWENKARAIKFREGQSRSKVAKLIVQRHEPDMHQGSWLDTGVGAGFIQSLVSESISPCLHVGLDFSQQMLESHSNPYGERILASTFALPFRKDSFTLVTNFFSLSDYPNIKDAFVELLRTLIPGSIMSHTDYASGDEYWENRIKAHGKKLQDSTEVIGNINLRNLVDIRENIPTDFQIIKQEVIEYLVESSQMKAPFDLPREICRRFIFTEIYKPRESN
jgi:ubiquinone/menaquinone biosynthesis C-methylase UbiE